MEMEKNDQIKEKKPMTTKQKVFLGLRIAGNVVFYSLLLMLLIFSIMNINGGNGKTDYPHIFGKGFLSVQSDSMEHSGDYEPEEWDDYKIGEIKKGDLVNVSVFKKKNASKIKIGDVITFYDTSINALNTHRVVDLVYSKGYITGYICQGDKNVSLQENVYYTYEKYCAVHDWTPAYAEDGVTPDTDSTEYKNWAQDMYMITSGNFAQMVSVKNVKGVATSIKPGGGKTLDWMHDHWLAIFILPIIAILIVEIFLVIRNIMILRGEKTVEAVDSRKEQIIAEEKERMRIELLAEMYGGEENIPEAMRYPKKAEEPKAEEPKAEEPKEANEEIKEDSNDDAIETEESNNTNEEVNESSNENVEESKENKEEVKPEVESNDDEPQDDNKEE